MSSSLSTMAVSPEANASEQSRRELQAKLTGLGGLNGRQLSPEAKAKKLREACEGFESIFIQKMWQEMRNTVPKGGLLQGREERFWQDMYDQELAKSMTSAGGIGLADMMYEQLSRNLAAASRGAAGQGTVGAFTPQAVPLVPPYEEQASGESSGNGLPAQGGAPMPSIYDGEAPHVVDAVEAVPAAPAPKPEPVQPVATQQPAAAPVAPQPAQIKANARKTVKSRSTGDNAIDLAYLARRDAGDKLGSRAVRPPLHHRKQDKAKNVEPVEAVSQTMGTSPIAQTGNMAPGTADGLKAAMEAARAGTIPEQGGASTQLHNIVAAVQARNAATTASASATQAQAPTPSGETAEMAPVTRKVRYSTNIPSKNRAGKKGGDAIRLLNVDNVGVNSKAGKGLAAYHAAQEEAQAMRQTAQAATESARQPSQPAGQTGASGQDAAPISPLTAKSLRDTQADAGNANFAIPPLRSGDLRG